MRGVLQELLADGLRGIPNLCAAYLFGSRARGTQRPGSDVDVGIWLRKTPVTLDEYPLELAGALEQKLGQGVDLVVMNGAPSDLVHRILRDGILVLEKDRAARIAFEMQARSDFFDMAPIRALYRRGEPA